MQHDRHTYRLPLSLVQRKLCLTYSDDVAVPDTGTRKYRPDLLTWHLTMEGRTCSVHGSPSNTSLHYVAVAVIVY